MNINMLEIDDLAKKFGGRFKLTVLIQKRLKELVKGGAKLVDLESRNLIHVVLEEIRQGKVTFEGYSVEEPSEEGKTRKREKEKKE
jgi:DNA-directed RNA polymerase subunit omega